VSKTLGCSL